MFDFVRIVTVTRAVLPGAIETKKHLNFLPAHKSCLLKHNRLNVADESNSTAVKSSIQVYSSSTLIPVYSFSPKTISSSIKHYCFRSSLHYYDKQGMSSLFSSFYFFETGKYFTEPEIYMRPERVNYVFDTKNNVQQEMECEEMEMSITETEIDMRKPEMDA